MHQKARSYAFLLLNYRLRSENEIRERMKNKGYSGQIIDETLAFLKEKKFIDDNLFARAWIASRLRKPLGLRRIKNELFLKGVDRSIVSDKINEVSAFYCEEETVRKVAEAKVSRLKSEDYFSGKKRLYAYLLRRGFSPEVITDVLNDLCKQKS